MPELPDVTVYVERIDALFGGRVLQRLRVLNPFVLRSVDPPVEAFAGRRLRAARRVGKRIVLEFEEQLWIVMHLMIAGRLRLKPPGGKTNRSQILCVLAFEDAELHFTEASSRKRASIHCARGPHAFEQFDPGGLELDPYGLGADPGHAEANPSASADIYTEFARRLRAAPHTLKRALTDPALFAGIGNAYSDEILHAARLSPFARCATLTDDEVDRVFACTVEVMRRFTEAIRREVGGGFPDKVTAFRADMAVHGKFGKPCPVCGHPVQRIRYAENETNYCAVCQTEGRMLSDRALARLLKDEWPRTIEDYETRIGGSKEQ